MFVLRKTWKNIEVKVQKELLTNDENNIK